MTSINGVLQGSGASKGFLTTTSDFAPLLRKDPLILPLIPSRLELIDGNTLLARLEELARKSLMHSLQTKVPRGFRLLCEAHDETSAVPMMGVPKG